MIRARKKQSTAEESTSAESGDLSRTATDELSMEFETAASSATPSGVFVVLFLALLSWMCFLCAPSMALTKYSGGVGRAPRRTALEAASLHKHNIAGKLFVITGAYGGIGTETTRAILAMGGRVVIGGRSSLKVKEFIHNMSLEFPNENQVDGYVLDLADLESVREFANYVIDKYPHDKIALILNAGVVAPVAETKQGIELQMGTNVVGHFLLAKVLVNKTRRQVWLTSMAHIWDGSPRINMDYYRNWSLEKDAKGYDAWVAYRESKLGDILIAKEFQRRFPGLETASCHPGVIYTEMGKHVYTTQWLGIAIDFVKELPFTIATEGFWSVKTPQEGASTTITAVSLPSGELVNGGFYKDCVLSEESESARNMDDAKALFDWCDEVTKKYQ